MNDAARKFFPEPRVDDPTWATPGEDLIAWLGRSTLPKATWFRTFLNRNLGALPPSAATKIARDMKSGRFEAAHFELIVGRALQLLGAALVHEPEIAGRHPDWNATFADGTVVVECTYPRYMQDEARQRRDLTPLAQMVENLGPNDWSVHIHRLPRIGPAESRQELKRFLTREFSLIPPASALTHDVLIEGLLSSGWVKLVLRPKRISHTKVVSGPASGGVVDAWVKIREAVADKRRQVRGATVPRVLAIHGGVWSGLDDFDRGLFGTTPGQADELGDPAFVLRRAPQPTFAGVLAFPGLELTYGTEPVLYVHPRFNGTLPASLHELRRRTLVDGRIHDQEAAGLPLMTTLDDAATGVADV